MKAKSIFVFFVAGAIAGFFAGVIFVPSLIHSNFLHSANILSKLTGSYIQLTPTPTTTPSVSILLRQDSFSEAAKNVQDSVVAIQSFNGNRVISSGSGIILTQDGLIGTVNSVVPTNAGIIQIIYSGKIYTAKVLFRDFASNFAIISFSADNPEIIGLKEELPVLGDELLIFSKLINFGKDEPYLIKTIVSQFNENNGVFKIQVQYDPKIIGSAIVDSDGLALGLLNFRNGQPEIIFSKQISDTLNKYLSGSAK